MRASVRVVRVKAVRRFGIVCAMLGTLAVMLAVPPVVSAKSLPSVRSRLNALAQSSAGKKAERELTAAVPVVGVARAAQGLLVQHGSEVTPFESSLLKVATLIGAPKNQAVLSALSAGRRLTAAQVGTLRRLLVSVAANPAVKLLVQKGRALQRSPKTLASYLATDTSAPSSVPATLPSTGDAALDGVDAKIDRALRSASVASVDARLRKLLSGPGAARYLRTLPSLAVTALVPPLTLESYTLPGERPRVALANSNLSPTTNASLRLALNADLLVIEALTHEAALQLLTGPAAEALVHVLDDLGWDDLVVATIGGYAAAVTAIEGAALIGGIELGERLTQDIDDLIYTIGLFHPLGLKIVPDANVQMTAGQPMPFVVDGLGHNLLPLGPEPGATVNMVPNGGPCPAQICTTTVAGPDGVTATLGDVTTSIPVTVLPGPLTTLTVTPTSDTIPLGTDITFAAAGADQYGNPIDPTAKTTFSIDPGSPSGWCVGATCGANTPGTYTVTATSGSVANSTTLTVTGTPANLKVTAAPGQWLAGTEHDFLVDEYDAAGDHLATLGGSSVQLSVTLNSSGASDGTCDTLGCTANSPGAHTVTATYQVPDNNQTITGSLAMTVTGPLDHLTLSPASASIAAGGSETYTVERYDAADDDLGPDFNAILTISPDGSCSAYTCTPANTGEHTVTATDGTATGQADLTVDAGEPVITTDKLDAAWIGTPYSQTLEAQGGTPPYTWQITGGSLPGALALDPSTGVISGTLPSSATCFPCDTTDNLTVQVTDANGQTAFSSVPLLVGGTPPPCTSGCSMSAALSPGAACGVYGVPSCLSVTSAAYVPAQCWFPAPGYPIYPDGNPMYYQDDCYLSAVVLGSDGAHAAPAYSRADVAGDVLVQDGQNPSTINEPFTQGYADCYGLPDYTAGNTSCAGDETWLELWFVPGDNLADASLLAMSNELTLPGP
jgi:hypothetical protein